MPYLAIYAPYSPERVILRPTLCLGVFWGKTALLMKTYQQGTFAGIC